LELYNRGNSEIGTLGEELQFQPCKGKGGVQIHFHQGEYIRTIRHESQPHIVSSLVILLQDMAQYIFSAQTLKTLHPDSTVYKTNQPGSLPGPLENPTVLPIDLLRRFKHTFLIRTPQKSVPSYWKCVHKAPESDSSTNWPGQIQSQVQPPPLIDASVLLGNPDYVLKEYCSALGIPFDNSMLTWESGPVEEFAAWGTYHSGAENSTGFKKETPIEKEAQDAGKKVTHYGGGLSDTASSEADTETESSRQKAKKQMPEEVLETIR
jgi:hypothetical protein